MKKLSEAYTELGIDFTVPIEIRNAQGNRTYFENSNGYWHRWEYDAKGNETYFENSKGFWSKSEYDAQGNRTYYEDSDGRKRGTPRSKVIEIDGKKYKLTEI